MRNVKLETLALRVFPLLESTLGGFQHSKKSSKRSLEKSFQNC